MSRRNRRRTFDSGLFQDPGKDLFAFLFLMVMVFSFMVLMSSHELVKRAGESAQSITQESPGQSSLVSVADHSLGRLVKKGTQIYIVFGNDFYSPITDIQRMETDSRISIVQGKDGKTQKVIYLEEKQSSKVLLEEYLQTFKTLSDRGVGVAFSERIEK